MYKCLREENSAHYIFNLIWKSPTRLRHKIFFWLHLYDGINTRNLLHRKSMYLASYSCALCSENSEETLLRLFWDGPFALSCWKYILPQKPRGSSRFDELSLSLNHLPGDIGLTILIASCWGIWSVHNDKIFRSVVPHLQSWTCYLKDCLDMAMIRANASTADKIKNWIENNL